MGVTPAEVLVLGGGPDAERDVSLRSAAAVAEALRATGEVVVHERTLAEDAGTSLSVEDLVAMPGDVAFPVLHGRWGEGGPLQALLERSGKPFVGCDARAARLAIDKLAAKLAAASAGVATAPAIILSRGNADGPCPIELPAVLKPVHEGSSVGLAVCRSEDEWRRAAAAAAEDGTRVYMLEAMVAGREVTVSVLDGLIFDQDEPAVLPTVEVRAAGGVYDFAAKYERTDTTYAVGAGLNRDLEAWAGRGIGDELAECALDVWHACGVSHLARVDFIVPRGCMRETDGAGTPLGPVFLELNTMPGATATSLLPMAAASAGLSMSDVCLGLIEAALADGPRR